MRNVKVTIPMRARMQQLRDAKISCEAIARVIELDFGARPSATTVRGHTRSPFSFADRCPEGICGLGHHNGRMP